MKKTNQRIKGIGNIPDTLVKASYGLMTEWKVHQGIAKYDKKHRGASKGTWCLLVKLRFPAFIFCMGKRLIKVVYERKINNVKKI